MIDIDSEVQKTILQYLPTIIQDILTINQEPYVIRALYTVTVVSLKQGVKMGILTDSVTESEYYSQVLSIIIQALIPKIQTYLQLQMSASTSPINLIVTHTSTLVSEIFKLQQQTLLFIKEKETLLLHHKYSPENAIEYITSYYQNPKKSTLLPLAIGFSYIFADMYQHVHEITGFKFDPVHVKQVQTQQMALKHVSYPHLTGPNGEFCSGSVEFLLQSLINSGVVNLLVQQSGENAQCSVLHSDLLEIVSVMCNYKFKPDFCKLVLNDQFFGQIRMHLIEAVHKSHQFMTVNNHIIEKVDKRVEFTSLRERAKSQVRRTSLDSLVSVVLKKVALSGVEFGDNGRFLLEVYQIKEALGL
ncbi:Conserved_hypothetical protein [Hexamita inflata]|uniref:Uncharacterized protein n=1 Tax=Hexamita inflata TaxID=28002 RepID=A0AA86PKW9_9EUKA|nr:Conserved hypothetical protein [Hexamita inflata]